MIINKIPFQINFPLKILKDKKISFGNKKEREKIFKRNIYYYKYGIIKNSLLEKRNKIFFSLAKEVVKFVGKKDSHLYVLSISIFGSSLYSKKPNDFDFLVITKGNIFFYYKTELTITENGKKVEYSIGISIKGIENFSNGIFDSKSDTSLNFQSQTIYRTVISLFRRHIPIIGYDFIENKKAFLKNGYAQVSDLLNNVYELYYLRDKKSNLNNRNRAKKILSRTYEAISYMHLLGNNTKIRKFKRKIAILIENEVTLQQIKKIFDEVVLFYNKKSQDLNKNFRDKKEVLTILLNENLKNNIKERLKNYWKVSKLPYQWINQIIDILSKYSYNEDLAIKRIREKFPSIPNKNSIDYSKKLENFRKIKIKNLAKRIKREIYGKVIADIGGRTDDFIEQIIRSNKKLEKGYVTDLSSFTARSKNPKINFIVQSSSTKMPFPDKTIDTIILSMVLHHLNKKQQREMIKNLILCLKDRGKIILIEDTFPEKIDLKEGDKITKDFLKFKSRDKKKILCFYDWFGNKLMRNRDNTHLVYNYKTMEEWKKIIEIYKIKQIKSEFIKENKFHPDIFPPKAILIFQK